MRYIWITESGLEGAAETVGDLRAAIEAGTVAADTIVKSSRDPRWLKAGEHEDFAPILELVGGPKDTPSPSEETSPSAAERAKFLARKLGERLREARKARNYPTGKAFAVELGIDEFTYRFYERDRCPPIEVLEQISKRLRVSLHWLLLGEGDSKIPKAARRPPQP